MVAFTGLTPGELNGKALIVTATAFDTAEAQPVIVLITV